MCYFVPYIELAVTHTSVLTILAITVERYYAICLPLQVKNYTQYDLYGAARIALLCALCLSHS